MYNRGRGPIVECVSESGTRRITPISLSRLIITESYRKLPKATESYWNLLKASRLVQSQNLNHFVLLLFSHHLSMKPLFCQLAIASEAPNSVNCEVQTQIVGIHDITSIKAACRSRPVLLWSCTLLKQHQRPRLIRTRATITYSPQVTVHCVDRHFSLNSTQRASATSMTRISVTLPCE